MFCAPPEIDRKISEIAHAHSRENIEVRDVLYWSMEETIANTKKILPIWIKQGISYQKHLEAWDDIRNGGVQELPRALLEQEKKTLKEHYGFAAVGDESVHSIRKNEAKTGDLDKILDKCKKFGVTEFGGARMMEEQERELDHEVECERENQRPPQVRPTEPHLCNEVRQFITSGSITQHSNKIIPAFSVLDTTSANVYGGWNAFSPLLLATSDFCDVIQRVWGTGTCTDEFLRPVNWIVSSTVNPDILVILSSYEVNLLLPEIRQSRHVRLHMYSPRVALSMPSYESLDFCPIPSLPYPWQPDINLVDQLNIFAGQLYFRNYEAYERVCGFLGLYLDEPSTEKRVTIHSDGFVAKLSREILGMTRESPFDKSPVPLLRALVGFRRKGQSSIATDMGHVLHGRLLKKQEMDMRGNLQEV